MSDQIAVMNAGAREQVATPREIYAPAADLLHRPDFLGAMNWLDGVGVRPEAVEYHEHVNNPGRKAIVTGL